MVHSGAGSVGNSSFATTENDESYHGRTHFDSDDDTIANKSRSSAEMARFDRETLGEEEERERLLMVASKAKGWTTSSMDDDRAVDAQTKGHRRSRRSRRDSRKHFDDEGKQLMYEMEEGGPKLSRTPSSSASSDIDSTTPHVQERKTSRRARLLLTMTIYTAVFVLLLLILYGAYRASTSSSPSTSPATDRLRLRTNGTHLFAATTLLLSIDGFRADYLARNITPTLAAFIREGVSPPYMLPSFPSVTFPNHFTLVTGLYPESHGVVGNSFWDPELGEEFWYTDPARSLQGKWWKAEPLWVTAEDQGVRSAIHMWPGSEAHLGDVDAEFVDKFNGSELLSVKMDRVLDLLDKPGLEANGTSNGISRPQFIAAYVPNVDADGHRYGPNSTEINVTIQNVDDMLASLLEGLKQRNLTEIVNIIIVSDHGMATTSTERLIQLEDLVDLDMIEHMDGWPHYGLRPKNPNDTELLYDRLVEETVMRNGFDVYLRDRNMPERYHFSNNERIAPLWIIPKTGWAIVNYDEFNVAAAQEGGELYHPRGLHGYDHEHPLMRSIFVARGPAFPHVPGSRLSVFQNIEVYNIVCDSIGVVPNPNNGTLRLPLTPVGIHGDADTPPVKHVADDPADITLSSSTPSIKSATSVPLASTEATSVVTSTALPTETVVHDGIVSGEVDEQEGEKKENKAAWQWFTDKWNAFTAWVKGLTDGDDETNQVNESR